VQGEVRLSIASGLMVRAPVCILSPIGSPTSESFIILVEMIWTPGLIETIGRFNLVTFGLVPICMVRLGIE